MINNQSYVSYPSISPEVHHPKFKVGVTTGYENMPSDLLKKYALRGCLSAIEEAKRRGVEYSDVVPFLVKARGGGESNG